MQLPYNLREFQSVIFHSEYDIACMLYIIIKELRMFMIM
jgi:hypothetical protein